MVKILRYTYFESLEIVKVTKIVLNVLQNILLVESPLTKLNNFTQ
jgi:hypothetical protein